MYQGDELTNRPQREARIDRRLHDAEFEIDVLKTQVQDLKQLLHKVSQMTESCYYAPDMPGCMHAHIDYQMASFHDQGAPMS